MKPSDVRRLKKLEEENSKFKRIVADQAIEILGMKDNLKPIGRVYRELGL